MKFDKVFELSEQADKLKMLTHTFAALSAANETDDRLCSYALCMPVEALADVSAAIDRLVDELADEVRKEKSPAGAATLTELKQGDCENHKYSITQSLKQVKRE